MSSCCKATGGCCAGRATFEGWDPSDGSRLPECALHVWGWPFRSSSCRGSL